MGHYQKLKSSSEDILWECFQELWKDCHFYSNGDIAGSLCEQEYIHMFCERAIKICLG